MRPSQMVSNIFVLFGFGLKANALYRLLWLPEMSWPTDDLTSLPVSVPLILLHKWYSYVSLLTAEQWVGCIAQERLPVLLLVCSETAESNVCYDHCWGMHHEYSWWAIRAKDRYAVACIIQCPVWPHFGIFHDTVGNVEIRFVVRRQVESSSTSGGDRFQSNTSQDSRPVIDAIKPLTITINSDMNYCLWHHVTARGSCWWVMRDVHSSIYATCVATGAVQSRFRLASFATIRPLPVEMQGPSTVACVDHRMSGRRTAVNKFSRRLFAAPRDVQTAELGKRRVSRL